MQRGRHMTGRVHAQAAKHQQVGQALKHGTGPWCHRRTRIPLVPAHAYPPTH
jgi:hypothetical protein